MLYRFLGCLSSYLGDLRNLLRAALRIQTEKLHTAGGAATQEKIHMKTLAQTGKH